jgi:hypothetical protein
MMDKVERTVVRRWPLVKKMLAADGTKLTSWPHDMITPLAWTVLTTVKVADSAAH